MNMFTTLIALTACLLAVELGLRLADRMGWMQVWRDLREARTSSIWMVSEDSRLIYQHRPNYTRDGTVYTEGHGILRPTDVTEAPPHGAIRIAILGNSVAAAIDLAYAERMFTLLEDTLNGEAGAGRFEVLNFGVNGYSTSQQAAQLDVLVSKFEPHMLIVQFCMNDFHPTFFPTMWFRDHPKSYVLTLGKFVFERRLIDGYPDASYWEEAFRTDHDGWRSVADGFASIGKYARSRDIPVLVVIAPLLSQNGWSEGNAAGRHSRVRGLARDNGFEALDLLPLLSQFSIDSLRLRPWDTFHLNATGHRVVARAIAEVLWRHNSAWRDPAGTEAVLPEGPVHRLDGVSLATKVTPK